MRIVSFAMIKENILLGLKKEDVHELLGFRYFELAGASLGWKKQEFINRFCAYITEELAKESEKRFFDFLIELSSLTFTLYKWGVLLYNLDEKLYADRIITIRAGGRLCVISDPALFDVTKRLKEGDLGLALIDVEDKEIVFQPQENHKSHLLLILLYLYAQEDVGMFIAGLDNYDARFSGSYLSFDEKKAEEERDFMGYIKGEFAPYKERLEELQRLFYSSFKEKR